MYDTSDIRKGLKITIDGVPFVFVEFQFVKPGKGQAFTRSKMRNMISGSIMEKTWKQGEKFPRADLEERQMQFLYKEGEDFVFMDTGNYEQIQLGADQMADTAEYLLDGTMVDILLFEGRAIGITPPTFVELKVVETEPGFKGDTSGNTGKPATMNTGLKVQVPLFVNEGETIRIDTRTGEYVERVKK